MLLKSKDIVDFLGFNSHSNHLILCVAEHRDIAIDLIASRNNTGVSRYVIKVMKKGPADWPVLYTGIVTFPVFPKRDVEVTYYTDANSTMVYVPTERKIINATRVIKQALRTLHC